MSEFATPSAFLSMVVTSAGLRKMGQKEQARRRRLRGGSFGGVADSSEDDLTDSDDLSSDGMSGEESDDEDEGDSGGRSRSPSCPPGDESVTALPSSSASTTVIDLVLVQPKSLQECRIVYEDALQVKTTAHIVVGIFFLFSSLSLDDAHDFANHDEE